MDEPVIVKRPKAGDGEEELFQMQDEFLKSRQQPSAKVINLRAQHKHTTDITSKLSECEQSGMKFRSKFAERRALKDEKNIVSTSQSDGDIINPNISEDILHNKQKRNTLPDVVQDIPENPSRIILGNIVEKKYNTSGIELCNKTDNITSDTGFPRVFTIDNNESTDKAQSLFYQNISMSEQHNQTASTSHDNNSKKSINSQCSILIQGSLNSEIHKSNIEKINNMTEDEILKEKSHLESTLNPDIIKFLKAKKNSSMQSNINIGNDEYSPNTDQVNIQECKSQLNNENESHTSMDISTNINTNDNATLSNVNEIKMDCDMAISEPPPPPPPPPPPVTEIVDQAIEKGWIHMDELEPVKLEWMKDISIDKNNEISPDKPYNARFDFDGMLLPFQDEKISIDRGLHHHGEEPERPGYSLQELLQLTRSSAQQQRCTALTTLGNIMNKSRKGWYDKTLDPPPLVALHQRNILLLLRFSLDDTSIAVISATLQALRSFLYSETDEICMDRLCGWEYTDGSCLVPDLLPPKNDVNDTSELKDDELAQLDCIAAAMRSDIVLRIRYIIDEVHPPLAAITYAMEILIRLARHSRATALNISTTPQLLEIIVNNFIPLTTNRRIAGNDIHNAYGIPNVAAIRLCRVLMEYAGRPVADRLNNLKIIHSLHSYVTSDASEIGLQLAIEALRLWRLLLTYDIARDSLDGAKLVLNSQLQLLRSNHDITSASELSSEYAAAIVIISSYDSTFKPIISTLLTKWSTQLAAISSPTWSNTKLVAVTLSVLGDISALKTDWIVNSNMFSSICSASNLLCGFIPAIERDPTSLPCLGVLTKNGQLQPVVSLNSCIPFLATLFNSFAKASMRSELTTIFLNADIIKYLRRLVNSHWSLESSWYTRVELFLLTGLVRIAMKININDLMKELLIKTAIKVISALPSDAVGSVKEILEIILSNERLTVEKLLNDLSGLKLDSCSEVISLVLPSNVASIYEDYLSSNGNWNEFALPQDWPYLPLVSSYTNYKDKILWNESDTTKIIVSLSLEFAMPEIFHGLTPTLRFTRIILVYLCDTIYLNNNISVLLTGVLTNLLKKYHKVLNFSKILPGLTSFTDLFTSMCECFAANSYGNDGFAMALLVPIAQRHDNHYRKLLWSEHAAALRYIRLTPEKMIIPIIEYLKPLEDDITQIECYITSLIRGTVKEEWSPVMYIIALHHSAMYLRGTSTLITKMRDSIASIEDTNLSDNILNYVSIYE